MRMAGVAIVLAGMAQGALAEGCAITGGVAVPEIEAMNQMMLDGRNDEFSTALAGMIAGDFADTMTALADVYPDGFTGCRTIAQRQDTGGMTQNLVMFESAQGPLFLYWNFVVAEGNFSLLKFNLDSDLDLLEQMR